jgi:thioesterase domain-containing protein
MAQQLHAQGQEVAVLALFDTYFPGPKTRNVVQKVDRLLGTLLLRSPKDQMRYLIALLRVRAGTSVQGLASKSHPDSEGSLARGMREVRKANYEALRNYVPQVYPGRILFLLSSEAPERSFYDARFGWSDMAARGLEVHVVPGTHDTLFEEPNVMVMAEKVRVCLQRVPVYSRAT